MDTGPDPKLVVGLSLDALFTAEGDDSSPNAVTSRPLQPGPALPLVRRLLRINERAGKRLVEVVVASEAGHHTALQVMTSAKKHDLEVVGWAFTDGRPVWPYLESLQCNLYLSTSTDVIVAAVDRNVAAARILPVAEEPDGAADGEVRILLDGDAVLFDAGSERIYEEKGLTAFVDNETRHADTALTPGVRAPFFAAVGRINSTFPAGERPIRLSLLTGRNAVAHEKIVAALDEHGVGVSETVLVGGLDKSAILGILRPHIHFDEHTRHLVPERGSGADSREAVSSATAPSEPPTAPTSPPSPPAPSETPAATTSATPRTAGSSGSAAAGASTSGTAVTPGMARATAAPATPRGRTTDHDADGLPPPPVTSSEASDSAPTAREHIPASITPTPPAPPATPPAPSDTAADVAPTSKAAAAAPTSGATDDETPAATGDETSATTPGSSTMGFASRARRSDGDGDDAPVAGADAASGDDDADAIGDAAAPGTNGSSGVVVIDGLSGVDESEDAGGTEAEADAEADAESDAGAASGRRGLFRRSR